MNVFGQDYMKARTEDDIIAQAPIKVKLGGVEYPLRSLPILKNREWRDKMVAVINEVMSGSMGSPLGKPADFAQGFMVAFMQFPAKILDLVIAYAPDKLDKQTLEEAATDEELVIAFSRILSVAYPFFDLLGTMKVAAAAASQATSRQ